VTLHTLQPNVCVKRCCFRKKWVNKTCMDFRTRMSAHIEPGLVLFCLLKLFLMYGFYDVHQASIQLGMLFWTLFYTCILGPSYQALLQPGIIFYDLDFNSYAWFLESQCQALLITGSYISVINLIMMKDKIYLFNLIFLKSCSNVEFQLATLCGCKWSLNSMCL
jgi:hypothetical protein